jgi:hypothetical protein
LDTGTGIRAIEISEKFPDARFIGVDLNTIQSDFVPFNIIVGVEVFEGDWRWPENHFDVIYSYFMLRQYLKYSEILRANLQTLRTRRLI